MEGKLSIKNSKTSDVTMEDHQKTIDRELLFINQPRARWRRLQRDNGANPNFGYFSGRYR